jgi:ectoine hydroxylase-related dioxygenase (phytanoyl-CoA dioxygenase family)
MATDTGSRADADLDRLAGEGFVELGRRLSEDDLTAVLAHFDDLDARPRISPGYQAQYDGEGDARRLRKLRRLVWNDRDLYGPILNRMGAADLAEAVIGPDAVVILHAAFLKPAGIGTHVAPHQDQALWIHEYPGAFSMWTALTEVHPGNGGLYGHARSHTSPLDHADDPDHPWHASVAHLTGTLEPAQQFVLKPGEVVMWDRWLVHGSGRNTSPADRRGMVVVFADGSADNFQARDVIRLADLRALA